MKKNKEQQDQERRQAEEERRTTVKHCKKGTGRIRKRAEYQEEEKER